MPAGGVAYAEDDDASERDFVFTVNEPGWQRQIPQSVYNLWPLKLRLKRAAQRSAVERHKTQDKGERRSRAQAENLSRNVAGISMFQCCKMLGERASACPGKLMDVQSFSGTKNK